MRPVFENVQCLRMSIMYYLDYINNNHSIHAMTQHENNNCKKFKNLYFVKTYSPPDN